MKFAVLSGRCVPGVSSRITRVAIGMVAPLWLAGCGAGTRPPPEAGFEWGGVPGLVGRPAGHEALDLEVECALRGIGHGVGWVFPDDLRAALERNPGVGVQLADFPSRRSWPVRWNG